MPQIDKGLQEVGLSPSVQHSQVDQISQAQSQYQNQRLDSYFVRSCSPALTDQAVGLEEMLAPRCRHDKLQLGEPCNTSWHLNQKL
jgi:hypothetical protein